MALRDSVDAFRTQYQTSSITIVERDSSYKYNTMRKIKCPQGTDEFERNGYGCACDKWISAEMQISVGLLQCVLF